MVNSISFCFFLRIEVFILMKTDMKGILCAVGIETELETISSGCLRLFVHFFTFNLYVYVPTLGIPECFSPPYYSNKTVDYGVVYKVNMPI